MAKKKTQKKGVPRHPVFLVIRTQYDFIDDVSATWKSFKFASNAGDNAICSEVRITDVDEDYINEQLKIHKNCFVYLTNNVWKSLCKDVNNEFKARACCNNIITICFNHKAKLYYIHNTEDNDLGLLGQEILKNADLYLYNGQVMAKN